VTYVKPHGALANMANDEDDVALAIGRGIKGVNPALVYMVMPGLATERAAETLGLAAVREVYADRAYDDTGNLTSRKTPGAVLHDAGQAAARVLRMIHEQAITTITGKRVPAQIETICVHGDTPSAVAMARTLREMLEANGIAVAPFRSV
jgi:UPF0271 protein